MELRSSLIFVLPSRKYCELPNMETSLFMDGQKMTYREIVNIVIIINIIAFIIIIIIVFIIIIIIVVLLLLIIITRVILLLLLYLPFLNRYK